MENNMIMNSIELKILSKSENIGLTRVAIASFAAQADITLTVLEEIKVAVSEAVSNAIIHGYQGSINNIVIIQAELYIDKIEIKIKDTGVGIEDIERAMQPAYSTDPERMGLGFMFMKSFMDDVKIISEKDKGTDVFLIKKIIQKDKNEEKN